MAARQSCVDQDGYMIVAGGIGTIIHMRGGNRCMKRLRSRNVQSGIFTRNRMPPERSAHKTPCLRPSAITRRELTESMTTERCTSGPKWISESELAADECRHVAKRGSGQEFTSPLLMSVGGEITLSAG